MNFLKTNAMKKLLLGSVILLAMLVAAPASAFAQNVYLTPASGAVAYHKTKTCSYLQDSKVVNSVTEAEARKMGRHACPRCYGKKVMAETSKTVAAGKATRKTVTETKNTGRKAVEKKEAAEKKVGGKPAETAKKAGKKTADEAKTVEKEVTKKPAATKKKDNKNSWKQLL